MRFAPTALDRGARRSSLPRPDVAKPKLRQDVDLGRVRPPIRNRDPHQDVDRRGLRIFDEHVEIAIVGEQARIEQLEFRIEPPPAQVLLQQPVVREGPLRILVQHLQIGVGRRGVEIVVQLLDVLAVIPFRIRQAEQPLLENRIVTVPQGQRQAEPLLIVAEARQAVFAPAIGAAAGNVVREIGPGVFVFAIVLADGSPLTLAQISAPFAPRLPERASLLQAVFFGGSGNRRGVHREFDLSARLVEREQSLPRVSPAVAAGMAQQEGQPVFPSHRMIPIFR